MGLFGWLLGDTREVVAGHYTGDRVPRLRREPSSAGLWPPGGMFADPRQVPMTLMEPSMEAGQPPASATGARQGGSVTEATRNLNAGHGHVHPRPDGVKARCGGPGLCPECSRELMESGRPVRTGLCLALNCEDWDVFPDTRPDPDDADLTVYARTAMHRSCQRLPVARLRRIGWLDQLGRVWLRSRDWDGKGGSLTPLLIDPGERDGT